MGNEVFPFRDWKVQRPIGPLAPGIDDRRCGVIEGFADIVEGITNDASERFWNILFWPEGYAVSRGENGRSPICVPFAPDWKVRTSSYPKGRCVDGVHQCGDWPAQSLILDQ